MHLQLQSLLSMHECVTTPLVRKQNEQNQPRNAISMTLISKIGNHFFQKQQKIKTKTETSLNGNSPNLTLLLTLIYINRIEN